MWGSAKPADLSGQNHHGRFWFDPVRSKNHLSLTVRRTFSGLYG
jgi:hypothetical protein